MSRHGHKNYYDTMCEECAWDEGIHLKVHAEVTNRIREYTINRLAELLCPGYEHAARAVVKEPPCLRCKTWAKDLVAKGVEVRTI